MICPTCDAVGGGQCSMTLLLLMLLAVHHCACHACARVLMDGGSSITPAAQLVAQLALRFKKGYLQLVVPNHLLLLRLLQGAN